MKSASAGLVAALNGGQKFLLADLYTFTLANASVVRIAVADTLSGLLPFGGNSFDASGIVIERGSIDSTIGVTVADFEFTIRAQPAHLLGGVPWLKAIRQGALDGARLRVETLYMTTPGDTSLGTVVKFTGKIGRCDEIGRSHAKMVAHDDRVYLAKEVPTTRFQPACLNTLFDSNCGLTKASFAVASSVAGTVSTLLIATSLTQPADYFSLGTIAFISGVNSGVSVGVKSFSGGLFTLMQPLLLLPTLGDTFNAYPGCKKTKAACSNTNTAVGPALNNFGRFRGHPFVPSPELAL